MAPGPTSRGCEACRAQKKKCDLVQPACSRCSKLHIPCIGSGQKRFKYVVSKQAIPPLNQANTPPLPSEPASSPGNEATLLQHDLISRLQSPDDIGYDITFRYGLILNELPKHLGRNEALDAALTALLARHTEASLRKDQSDPRAPVVKFYNRALMALREILDDKSQNSTSGTLCAVMMLMFCQARFDDQFSYFWSPHGAGLAQLIRMRQFTPGKNLFEIYLFGTLNGTLLHQSFANPNVHLTTWEYRQLEVAFGSAYTADIRPWQLMVRMSEVMEDGRKAIASRSSLEAISARAREIENSMQHILWTVREKVKAIECQDHFDVRTHARWQRVYGVTLAAHAILLCAQRTISPHHPTLRADAASLCHDVLQIVQEAGVYRPLGAVWTVHTLICTWCATEDIFLKEQIQSALLDYQRDAMGPKGKINMDSLRLLERRLSLQE